MTTDFTYNNKTINSSGPIKPTGINQPLDPRTEVKLYADIESIPSPYVGMIITVLEDETNSNKMTDYKVLSLKADNLGVANSVIDQVQRYVDYLGVSSSGGGAGEGLTTEQAQQLTVAYTHSQTVHVTMEDVNEAISNITLGTGTASIIDYADGDTFSISNSTLPQTIEILTDQSSMTFMETGGGDTLGVKLSSAPSSNVTVNLTIANGYCRSNKSSLTFTTSNYGSYQYFTLTGVEDISSYSDKTDVLTLSATGLASKTINVTISNTTEQPTPEEPTKTLTSISATYTQGSTVVYPSTSLDSLKSNLVVRANYNDSTSSTVTDYELSGTLTVGTSTITVTYQEQTTTFNVNVSEESSTDSTMLLYLDGEGNPDEIYGGGYAETISPFTWIDKSNNGYDVTMPFTNGGSWIKSELQNNSGYAAFSNASITCNPLTDVPLEQNFTLDMKFKTPSSANAVILGFNNNTVNAGVNGAFAIGYSSDNKIITRWHYDKPYISETDTTAVSTDVRVTLIKNGTSISLYKDGLLIGTDDTKAANLNTPCSINFNKINYKYIKIWNEVKDISEI